MESLEIAGAIEEVKTLPDGGLRIRLETQELSPEEVAKLFSLRGKYLSVKLVENNG